MDKQVNTILMKMPQCNTKMCFEAMEVLMVNVSFYRCHQDVFLREHPLVIGITFDFQCRYKYNIFKNKLQQSSTVERSADIRKLLNI